MGVLTRHRSLERPPPELRIQGLRRSEDCDARSECSEVIGAYVRALFRRVADYDRPLVPEKEQEIGRQGVLRVKRLLEASTRFELPYDSYQQAERVVLPMLTGHVETYDLNGDHLDADGRALTRIFVESKHQHDAGSQSAEFKRFLAQAYSGTEHALRTIKTDPKYEFMWATTCPWIGKGFNEVSSEEKLREAVADEIKRDPEVLVGGKKGPPKVIPDDHVINEDTVRKVAARLWVWVISTRHEEMTPSEEVRGLVLAHRTKGNS